MCSHIWWWHSFGYLLVKSETGEDVLAQKEAGISAATECSSTTGRLIACSHLACWNIAKGFFAVWLARKLSPDSPLCMSAGRTGRDGRPRVSDIFLNFPWRQSRGSFYRASCI